MLLEQVSEELIVLGVGYELLQLLKLGLLTRVQRLLYQCFMTNILLTIFIIILQYILLNMGKDKKLSALLDKTRVLTEETKTRLKEQAQLFNTEERGYLEVDHERERTLKVN